MIEIKAEWNEETESVVLDCKMEGQAAAVIVEAATIMTGLPEKIVKDFPSNMVEAFQDVLAANIENFMTEGENNALN